MRRFKILQYLDISDYDIYQKERKYGVFAVKNIIQRNMRKRLLLWREFVNRVFRKLNFVSAVKFCFAWTIARRLNCKLTIKVYDKTEGVYYLRVYTYDMMLFHDIMLNDDNEYDINYTDLLGATPKWVMDAGANIGLFTRYINRIYENVHFTIIEPEEDNYNVLEKNMSSVHFANIIKGALWKNSDILYIEGSDCGSVGYRVDEIKDTSDVLGEGIQGYSMLEIMKKYNVDEWDIVKIDIEGSEREVFAAEDTSWLNKTRMVIIELHDHLREGCSEAVMKVMRCYGFKYFVKGENVVFYRSPMC